MASTDPPARSLGDHMVRPALPEEADALADLHTAARLAAVPGMPAPVHTAEETRAWMAARLGTTHEVWVAEEAGEILGYLALSRTGPQPWLDDLYVRPGRTGQGIGTVLLELAKSLRRDGFALWVFESNRRARAFYRRQGLVELERTDGSGNEECAPDVRMAWPGQEPLAFLRRQIDLVDDELVGLLDQRVALSRAVQEVKQVPGHSGRDQQREAELVARMAERSTTLEEPALRRIMHEVITAGLEADLG